MKTRKVEYYRLWAGNAGDSGTWDTDFVSIPADTPEEKIAEAVGEAVAEIKWVDDIPVATGLYNTSEEEEDEDVCPDNNDGQHEPDFSSVSRDPDAAEGIVDICCKQCGRSGSVVIDPEEIQW